MLLLQLSPEAAASRGEYGEERYENVDFQRQARRTHAHIHDPLLTAHTPHRWRSSSRLYKRTGGR